MEPTRRYVDADNSCLFSSIGSLVVPDLVSTRTTPFLAISPNLESFLGYLITEICLSVFGSRYRKKLVFFVAIPSIIYSGSAVAMFGSKNLTLTTGFPLNFPTLKGRTTSLMNSENVGNK